MEADTKAAAVAQAAAEEGKKFEAERRKGEEITGRGGGIKAEVAEREKKLQEEAEASKAVMAAADIEKKEKRRSKQEPNQTT